MQPSLNEKIIEAIKEQHVKPIPRWHFAFKNKTFWGLILIATLLGGIAFATALFIITSNDWEVFEYINKSPLVYILQALPYLWFAVLGTLVAISRYAVLHTNRGYRYRAGVVVGMSILASIGIGSGLYILGFGTTLHEELIEQAPWYESVVSTKQDTWQLPDQGFITGKILTITPESVYIRTLDKSIWHITFSPDVYLQEDLVVGARFKFIGEQTGPYEFNAEDSTAWNK